MKRLLISTAVLALLSTPALTETQQDDAATSAGAQIQSKSDISFSLEPASNSIFGSDFIGARLYTVEGEVPETYLQDAEADWNDIGEISNIVMSRDGNVQDILVDVGGFLGIGEKTVAVKMDELKVISDGDDVSQFFVVFRSNREQLEQAPEYVYPSEREEADMREARDERRADASYMPTSAPQIDRDGYTHVPQDDLTVADLQGAPVYDANDDNIGEIGELLMADPTKLGDVVIDVGGFLGIGEKHVRLPLDKLNIQRADDGDSLRAYVNSTREQLEEMPAYDG
ncbi:PRC protein [Durusdinium trenchii]|uniref:PRC protein n=1 Tax=Durusdinium trenchii TaxID=1381693 RepID=A0ABP0NZP0_9DINO